MSDKKSLSIARAIKIAAELFLKRPFEAVSVKEIAMASHCSPTTLYDVFRNKQNLFLEAVEYLNRSIDIPRIERSSEAQTLEPLLAFALARIQFLADIRTREAFRAFIAAIEPVETAVRNCERTLGQLEEVAIEVERSIAAGLLLPHEPNIVAQHIFAGVSFEPAILGQVFRESRQFSSRDIVYRVFTLLVTPKGRTQLDKFLSAMDCAENRTAPAEQSVATPTNIVKFPRDRSRAAITDRMQP
jgi:AcrR family transcriptional regulator